MPVWSIHCWKWGIESPYYFCVTISTFISVSIYSIYLGAFLVGCLYNCYVSLMNPLLYHYIMNFFVSHENFCLKVYFIWSKYAMLCYAKSLQSCPTLCDPIDGSLPGSPVPGILQVRTLEWVAISFSNAWKWKVKSEKWKGSRSVVSYS